MLMGTASAESLEVAFARPAFVPPTRASLSSVPVPQSDQLLILGQERVQSVARLAAEMAVAGKGGSEEGAARIHRLQEDIAALDREIARAQKSPPPALRNTSSSAPRARVEVAQASAAASPSSTSPNTPETVAYERWDVFKSFGKQE
ncbi:hypothetical protein [Variovorax saccharolyticus]|uniref:hypothetical protein n=1 Tax=Variovorax saccharolyticus TaxID=3053516 RepID=UPI002576454D|nr:hypothetical protein [Variovorax sp. J31P216]MDM0029122.1 hypothetical protein [Variovorax sp. J31P216]